VAEDLIKAIDTLLAGKVYLSESMSSKLLLRATGNSTERTSQSAIESLADRELEVFGMLGQGMTTQQIATRMNVSPKTVDTFRARIKEKLGLTNSSELVFSAIRWVVESSQADKAPKAGSLVGATLRSFWGRRSTPATSLSIQCKRRGRKVSTGRMVVARPDGQPIRVGHQQSQPCTGCRRRTRDVADVREATAGSMGRFVCQSWIFHFATPPR
jgi:DNA-binding CsgD family transcriptional regulator